MGKLKKWQRVERSKVKLKKKQLLKAQNVTDTSFKIRKIVIPTQLKELSGNEPVSKRKLNIKELTSRLKHHNDSARQGALAGLREVTAQHADDVLGHHFLVIAQALAEMIVSEVNTKIRREALKLLQAILSQVPAEKMLPFFKVLLWHLTCAMTHINARIQEDSLFLFDILLDCAPSLVASAVADLLPSLLNMISRLCAESRPGRTLTLDLGSNLTTVRWRGEVLARVQSFLRAVLGSGERRKATAAAAQRVYRWSKDEPLYAPAYPPHPLPPCELPGVFHRTITESTQGGSVEPQAYAKELMPLLFETWLEVRPSSSLRQKVGLNQEAGRVLAIIVDIVQLVYDFLSLSEHQEAKCEEMRKWFAATYRDDFNRYIVADFPFAQAERESTKGQGEPQSNGDVPVSMRLTNLTVCYLFLVLNTVHSDTAVAKVSRCIKRNVGQWHALDENSREQLLKVLRCVLLSKCCRVMDTNAVMRVITAACLRQPGEGKLFQLLCELANHRSPLSEEVLSPWLSTLPQLLCQPEVSSSVVDSLCHLACQRIPAFLDSFIESVPQFIRHLGTVKVRGDDVDGLHRLAGLLYWVPSWSDENAALLRSESASWDPALACYVSHLVST